MASNLMNPFTKLTTLGAIDHKEKSLRDTGQWDSLTELQAELQRFHVISELHHLDASDQAGMSQIPYSLDTAQKLVFRGKICVFSSNKMYQSY